MNKILKESKEKDDDYGDFLFLKHFLERCESDIGVTRGAVQSLPKEDDWSFIIKLAAILEKSLNHLICKDINDQYIEPLILELPLARKIQQAYIRKLIDHTTKSKFSFIVKARNEAAHTISFTFKDYFKDIDILNEFIPKFQDVWNDPVNIGGKTISRKKFLKENPKLTLFLNLIEKISHTNVDIEIAKIKKNREQLQYTQIFFKSFLKGLAPDK